MGLTQGITELFPVSSLGHGVLLPDSSVGTTWSTPSRRRSRSSSPSSSGYTSAPPWDSWSSIARPGSRCFAGWVDNSAAVPSAGVSSLWHLNDPETDQELPTPVRARRRHRAGRHRGHLARAQAARPLRQAARRGDLPHDQRRHLAGRRAPSSQQRPPRPIQETRHGSHRAAPSPSGAPRSSRSSPESRAVASRWWRA